MASNPSSSIPLPISHIHRTRSELQFVNDTRLAEYEDERLYARLVAGMRSRWLASGDVHPLTRQSLLEIYQTKRAMDDPRHPEEDDEDWGLSYGYGEEQDESVSVDTLRPCHPLGTARRASIVVKTQSKELMVSNLSHSGWEDPEENECMFSLEM